MKLTKFGTFLIYVYLLIEIKFSYGEFPERYSRNIHDAFNFIQNAVKMIETANGFGIKNGLFSNSDVHIKLIKDGLVNLIPVFLKVSKSAQIKRCLQDLWYLQENMTLKGMKDSWAMQMLDSFGRPVESGFLLGNFKWVGNFDECVSAYAPPKKGSDVGGYHGQYCSLDLRVGPLPLLLGFCIPETCNLSDFKQFSNLTNLLPAQYRPNFNSINSNINSTVRCFKNGRTLSKYGKITVYVISLFLFLTILGSSATVLKNFSKSKHSKEEKTRRSDDTLKSVAVNFDYEKLSYGLPNVHFVLNEPSTILDSEHIFPKQDTYQIKKNDTLRLRNNAEKVDANFMYPYVGQSFQGFVTKCDDFLNCFCVFTNGSKLFNTNVDEGQLQCVHGIRFLSMVWIILSHVYISPFPVARTLKDALPIIDNVYFQFLMNGWYAVDSFFLLSGFLMSYLYFQDRTKRISEISWFNFYLHRILRLTPVYAILLAFFATVMPILGSGPFWVFTYDPEKNCQKTWWWNFLFINNFQDLYEGCMPWSWYLANEMQFFFISPLFLITLWRWPQIGYTIIAAFLCGTWIVGFFLTYFYGLIVGSVNNPREIPKAPLRYFVDWETYLNKFYLKPYIRIAPYLIGIALGHIMFKRRNAPIQLKRITLWFCWFISISIIVFCIAGLYGHTPGVVGASFYNALNRTGWGLGLGWIIFACLSGQGGIVDKILCWRYFLPFSRVTYCAYLVHPLVLGFYIFSIRSTLVFNNTTMIFQFLGILVLTFIGSILVSLIFESPLIRLEKHVKNRLQSRCKCS